MAYLTAGSNRIDAAAGPGAPARLLLLIGGEPLGERMVMWWNFVGRSHEEIVTYRRNWQSEIGAGDDVGRAGAAGPPAAGTATSSDMPGRSRFGTINGNTLGALPAPVMPNVRLRPRS